MKTSSLDMIASDGAPSTLADGPLKKPMESEMMGSNPPIHQLLEWDQMSKEDRQWFNNVSSAVNIKVEGRPM